MLVMNGLGDHLFNCLTLTLQGDPECGPFLSTTYSALIMARNEDYKDFAPFLMALRFVPLSTSPTDLNSTDSSYPRLSPLTTTPSSSVPTIASAQVKPSTQSTFNLMKIFTLSQYPLHLPHPRKFSSCSAPSSRVTTLQPYCSTFNATPSFTHPSTIPTFTKHLNILFIQLIGIDFS